MLKKFIFAAALSFSPAVLTAQDAKKDSTARQLDTVAVRAQSRKPAYLVRRTSSATRTDLPLRDVPQSVTVISKAVIADQSAQSMAEIARFIPGVTFSQGEGHRDAPTIRGNASTADFFLDGVRDDAQYLRDTYNIERVEALKGSNSMVFGRGGGGGVINRVTKFADWGRMHTLQVEGGSFDHKRTTVDIGDGLGPRAAARLNAMAENSGSFRASTSLARRGISPSATVLAGGNQFRFGYEYLLDDRTVDRGVPSFQGRPAPVKRETFFGDPALSRSWLYAHTGSLLIERESPGVFSFRNRTLVSSYDKSYQNVLPGAVTANGAEVNLTGYRNSHDRRSMFNQTDLVVISAPSRVQHTLLLGAEVGRHSTDNFRETAFFGNSTTLRVPMTAPSVASGAAFRQSATDADNNVRASVAGIYAQDQIAIGSHIQAIAGIRGEQFTINFLNNRGSQKLSRNDVMVSPRVGLNVKPTEAMSIYGSFSVSHLPGSGDQYSSLTATTSTLEPELFRNREIGLKWDIASSLSFSSSLYRLDRTNTSAPDPLDPSRVVQTGEQRSSGIELNLAGNLTSDLQIFAGFANQRAEILNRTVASRAGATVPMVPARSASLWSRYDIDPRFGVGVGVVAQSSMYGAIDNTVTLPGFARTDAALYLTPVRSLRVQVNVENLFNITYFANSQGNNNIMPGGPRTLRISLSAF